MPLAPALRGQSIRSRADVRLVGDCGHAREIHSILLMTLSPYFQIVLAQRQSENACDKECTIHLDNADSETLRVIVEYAYEGKITGLNSENVAKVERVADQYNIIGILNECEKVRGKSKEAPTL